MHARCTALCPPDQLGPDGTNARPHALEQWTAAEVTAAACRHARPTAEWLPAADGSAAAGAPSRGLSSTGPARIPSDFLSPVSAYRRSASALANEDANRQSAQLRTVDTLGEATRHLVHCVTPRLLPGLTFAEKYAYLSDRFRQIKKELTMQSTSRGVGDGGDACRRVAILEPMVRFHIASAYVAFGADASLFDRTMNQDRTEDCLQELLACCQCTRSGAASWREGRARRSCHDS